jgi:hypothetical protein
MEKHCATCRFFRPKHFELGMCDRQDATGSMLHTKSEPIFVSTKFGCVQHEVLPDVSKETV